MIGGHMVKVTETALSRLKRKLKRQPEGVAVRITVEDGHVQFRPDTEQKGDVVFARSVNPCCWWGWRQPNALRIVHWTL